MRTWRSALLTLALIEPACTDRAIRPSACGDAYADRGEVCFAEPSRSLRPDFEPLAMHIADFDGDEHLDVLVLGIVDWSVAGRLWRGDGEGDFGEIIDANLHGCSAYPIPGDLDGDPATDLIVDECGPSMLMFPGGEAGFGPARQISTGATTRTSAIIDIDGDGHNDVFVLGSDDAGRALLNVALGDGRGGFVAPATSPISLVVPDLDPTAFGLGDIDEDGRLDALLVDRREDAGGFGLARGRGDGSFEPPVRVLDDLAPVSGWLRAFDRDDHLDVLVRTQSPDELVLYRGDGLGGFEPGPRTAIHDATIIGAGLGDVDDDGRVDLLFTYPDRPMVEVWLGKGDGNFAEPIAIDVGGVPLQIVLGDFDENGAQDLVVGTFEEGTVRVVLAHP